jgi:hypothetical protein
VLVEQLSQLPCVNRPIHAAVPRVAFIEETPPTVLFSTNSDEASRKCNRT